MAPESRSASIAAEYARFDQLERAIERGLGTFVEVGRALLEIQRDRLYLQAGHRTFATYVAKRWDLSSAHAYRQIEASKVVDILSPIGEIPMPANEAQARELAALVDDPEAVRAVWTETIKDSEGRITAKSIREHVNTRRPRTARKPRSPDRPSSRITAKTCPECGHRWSD